MQNLCFYSVLQINNQFSFQKITYAKNSLVLFIFFSASPSSVSSCSNGHTAIARGDAVSKKHPSCDKKLHQHREVLRDSMFMDYIVIIKTSWNILSAKAYPDLCQCFCSWWFSCKFNNTPSERSSFIINDNNGSFNLSKLTECFLQKLIRYLQTKKSWWPINHQRSKILKTHFTNQQPPTFSRIKYFLSLSQCRRLWAEDDFVM